MSLQRRVTGVTVKSLTNSLVEQLLKQIYYFTFTYAYAAIGIGIPLDAATSAPPHQQTEQLPPRFLFLFLPSHHWK